MEDTLKQKEQPGFAAQVLQRIIDYLHKCFSAQSAQNLLEFNESSSPIPIQLATDDIKSKYPNASKYFLKDQIQNDEQGKYLEEMENYLRNQTEFSDINPKAMQGQYLRASKIFKSQKYLLFERAPSAIHRKRKTELQQKIEPKDIIQGDLADCYLLGSVASLINIYPQLIYSNFLFSENKAGFYVVRLFVDGEWRYVKTDDMFPCINGDPVYARPHGKQIWVMLLEKCWAKIFGSYEAISIGSSTYGLIAVTGIPSTPYFVQQYNLNQIKQIIRAASKLKNVISVSCGKLNENSQTVGLIPNHAYSFLDLCQINEETVVKLRNPWGYFTWKGDWSFDSSKWSKKSRKKFGYKCNPNDGTFYMPFQQFVRYFHVINVCHVTPQYKLSIFKIKSEDLAEGITLNVDVKKQGIYHFTVFQPDKRFFNQSSDYKYSTLEFKTKISKQNRSQVEMFSNNNASFLKNYLRVGVCRLGIKIFWKKEPYPITVNCYGPGQVTFEFKNVPYQ